MFTLHILFIYLCRNRNAKMRDGFSSCKLFFAIYQVNFGRVSISHSGTKSLTKIHMPSKGRCFSFPENFLLFLIITTIVLQCKAQNAEIFTKLF